MRIAGWWPSRRAAAFDVALAAVVTVFTVLTALQDPRPDPAPPAVRLVLAGLVGLAMLGRRRLPLVLLAVTVVDGLARGDLSFPTPFTAYALARYEPRPRVRWTGVGIAAVTALGVWQLTTVDRLIDNLLDAGVFTLLPAVLGAWIRTRVALLDALRGRAERAEREQQLRAREAVLSERARIAREMHDVVGHRVSLMVLQAGAIDMAAGDPDRVRQLAGQLQDAGRRSLEELRQLLGLLQDTGEEVPLGPQPTLADLDELVDGARRAGLEVTLTRVGPVREVDPTVGRTAYRVVQEGLTNAGKHAPGGAVAVTLETRSGELVVRVVNRRATRPPAELPSGGLGLIGLRERLRTVGGTLRAEPRLDGGFGVEAVMPG